MKPERIHVSREIRRGRQPSGGIFYVSIPGIGKSFFIPREAFLCAAGGLTGEW